MVCIRVYVCEIGHLHAMVCVWVDQVTAFGTALSFTSCSRQFLLFFVFFVYVFFLQMEWQASCLVGF